MLKERILPLLKVVGIEPKFVKKLSDLGIDSAEELVALVATPNGQYKLAKYLGVNEKFVKEFVETAKKDLPTKVRKQMEKPSVLKLTFGARIPKRRREFEIAKAKHPERTLTRPASQFAAAVQKFKAVVAPTEVNLISQMTGIRNQGSRGTCVAFASVAVREFLAGSKPNLSEQYLYWWCDAHDPVPEQPGTTVEMGFNGLVKEGICLESSWRYNPNPFPGNEGQGPPPQTAKNEASKYKLGSMLELDENSIQELKTGLQGKEGLPGRPIAFSVPVYTSWVRSKAVELSGQITLPLPGEEPIGGHAMVFVGYQDDASVPGGGFFIIRNSWGTAWGKNCSYGSGYGTIPFKYITEYCWEAFTGDAKPSGLPCLIATAAYDSPYADDVQFLRTFRDEKLKTTPGGSKFVDFYEDIYYSFSPYIAEKMYENSSVKNVIREFIVAPVVFFLKKAVGLIERKR